MIDSILKAQLERDEDRKLVAYKDNATPPNWTIGVGHLLGSSPRMSSITDAECDALLEGDIQTAARTLVHVFGIGTAFIISDFVRYRALINMAFNRGEGHMQQSTTITPAIKKALSGEGTWEAVSDAIKASPWRTQLPARADRIALQLKTGVDQ